MTGDVWGWEPTLWAMATQAGMADLQVESGVDLGKTADLADAYRLADEITRRHSRSFYLASGLLAQPTRSAIRSLYAFCRTTDDFADRLDAEDAAASLAAWEAGGPSGLDDDALSVLRAWRVTQRTYAIPQVYADQLIAGVRMDLQRSRYLSFDDLSVYAYRVASTVGLMSMHILGYQGPEAIPYAVRMGVALQATNILRDVGEDWRMGRLYLPLDELSDFGLGEADIERGQVTPAWRRYMRFAIERNRQLYEQAWPGLDLLSPQGRRSVGAAAELYRGILDAIEAIDYDVFRQRAHLDRWEKIRRLGRVLAPEAAWKLLRANDSPVHLPSSRGAGSRDSLHRELTSRGSSRA
jgi:phytoene synthase